jgi:predicted nuclease of restriction endonuclease-like (RecB) superfamily
MNKLKNKDKENIINKLPLAADIKQLIEQSRRNVAITVNSELTILHWNIGKSIKNEIVKEKRADYGKQIVHTLSKELTQEYGSGWSERQLHHCLRFAEIITDIQIVHTLCAQLTWSHIRLIISIDNDIKRDFYIELCKIEGWSVRVLQDRIKSMLFERTAISKKPEQTIQNDLQILKEEQKISPDMVFRDPYFLDFLGLKDVYSEKDLESNIILELEKFVIELGNDFAFMGRQKRITIDNRDYYIDLLFYHRRLKCLIAIDLKIGEFEASYKGQMDLYLRYLEKYEQLEGENSPIGLILCSGKNEEHIELMQLEKSNIKVADYLTILPPKKLLQEKLHKAIEIAHLNYEKRQVERKETKEMI